MEAKAKQPVYIGIPILIIYDEVVFVRLLWDSELGSQWTPGSIIWPTSMRQFRYMFRGQAASPTRDRFKNEIY
jgi:hypothetical protein